MGKKKRPASRTKPAKARESASKTGQLQRPSKANLEAWGKLGFKSLGKRPARKD
jgi:hypothetical protein